MFQLSEEETELMVSHFAIPSRKQLGGFLPYMFTEHGVLMLASVLKSDQAIGMSIKIIEVFVKLREMLLTNKDALLRVEQVEKQMLKHNEKIELLFNYLNKFIEKEDQPREQIGYRLGNEQAT